MPSLTLCQAELPIVMPRNVEFLLYWASILDEDEKRTNKWKKFLVQIGYVLFEIQVDYFLVDLQGMTDFIAIRKLSLNQPDACANFLSGKECHCTCENKIRECHMTLRSLSQRLLEAMWSSFV